MIRQFINQYKRFKVFAVILAAILVFGIGLMPPSNAATSILNVDSNTTSIDLTDFGKTITATKPAISIQGPGDAQPVELQGDGPGPNYYWSLYSIRNSSDANLEFVVDAEAQGFAGSGLLNLRPLGSKTLHAEATGGAELLTPLSVGDGSTFTFRLSSGQSINIALQSRDEKIHAELWQRHSFEDHIENQTFFKGLVVGIAFLITLGILALYSFRPHASLLAGWSFAISSLIFILFETGLLTAATRQSQHLLFSPSLLRPLTETLLSATLLLCVISFTGITKRKPVFGFALWFFFTALLANLVFSFVDADHAASFARFSFAIIVIAGFAITARNRNTSSAVVDSGLVFWLSVGAWALIAGVVTQSDALNSVLTPFLLACLTAVLVALVMVLLRYIFTQGLSSKPFITDANRRSLALSGARHILWDWQIQDQFLDIGDDLPKLLGYEAKTWQRFANRNFMDALHPVDAAVYESELSPETLQSGRHIDIDVRLRHSDGTYRWFELRSRVVPGPNNRPDRCIGTLTDVTKNRETEERLLADAVHDPVTGLPSRAVFMDRATRELNKPIGFQFRILLIDIDRFKVLNDALGHEQGDRLLQIVGERIEECLTEEESLARISGSQFAILAIEAIAQRAVRELADAISESLAKPMTMGAQNITLTASIGISNLNERGKSATEMLQQAASALLEAQRLGGAQAKLFDKTVKEERASEFAIEADLRRALASDEIEVHFQPISRLSDLKISGLEALARWRHPTRGLLPPIEFIKMAEQLGMISEIGQIVLATAARQLGVWQRVLRRDNDFFVSVNISPSHFLEKNFLEQIQTVLQREGLRPNSLKIEVTESVVMRHPERATRIFEQLRSLGVGIACDDFGTGFSNLSSLRDLPFDTLKIDKSFLNPENFDTRSSMIISTITDLAHGLGMTVVAEGIETQAHIDKLAMLGCDMGQGYFIGEPKSANDITDLLAVLPRFLETQQGSMSLSQPVDLEQEADFLPSIFALQRPETEKALKRAKPKTKKIARKPKRR
jgi:diguanylate cyclase (GGDEF)-like protein/PAS domain S-box-containing protein